MPVEGTPVIALDEDAEPGRDGVAPKAFFLRSSGVSSSPRQSEGGLTAVEAGVRFGHAKQTPSAEE